ncbi:Holliday junction resolvase [Thermus phage P74-26]|uniref:Archaeal-type Holliday junction resolvase n=1 Tax=Thermus phage P74-26 TaxID=2914007 RepID=A7XXL1_BP742|nr:Holliday junction resolvase [Thermus phage P74-26]ABU96992.1 Archaeal-type Holliday junction resolvase [Thermus phage P74-26]
MSRAKGRTYENELVALLQNLGLPAWRVPLSGALGGRFSSDVRIPLANREVRIEVKMRSNPAKGVATLLKSVPCTFSLQNKQFHVLRLEDLPLDVRGTIEVKPTRTVVQWLGHNDVLAIRLPKRFLGGTGWLIVISDSLLDALRSAISKNSSPPLPATTTTSGRAKTRSSSRRTGKSR